MAASGKGGGMDTRARGLALRVGMIATLLVAVVLSGVVGGTEWVSKVSPSLLGCSDVENVLILGLNPVLVPQVSGESYAHASHETWLSQGLQSILPDLDGRAEFASGIYVRDLDRELWEETLPYLYFLHAIVVRAPCEGIEEIAALPWVRAVWDGGQSASLAAIESTYAWSVSLEEHQQLTAIRAGDAVSSETFASLIEEYGWSIADEELVSQSGWEPELEPLPISNHLPSFQQPFYAITGFAGAQLEGWLTTADSDWPLDEVQTWHHGCSLSLVELCRLVDAARSIGAAFVTASTTLLEESEMPFFVFWEATSVTGTASAGGDVGGDPAEIESPEALLPGPDGVVATIGNSNDHISLKWDPVPGAVSYQVLRADNSASNVFSLRGTSSVTLFEDWEVELCAKYWYRIRAVGPDALGLESESTKSFFGNILAAPQNVRATDWTELDRIVLTWEPVLGATEYSIWRSQKLTIPLEELANSTVWAGLSFLGRATGTEFVDEDIIPNTSYWYRISARDACGSGALSGPMARGAAMARSTYATATSDDPPLPPETVEATRGKPLDAIQVTWSAVSDAVSYRIYRGEGQTRPTEFSEIAFVDGLSWDDMDIESCQFYWYRIASVDADGREGDASRSAYGVANHTPDGVQEIRVFDGEFTDRIRLEWDPTDRTEHYYVRRALSETGPAQLVANHLTETEYVDALLEPGQTYWYYVGATNGCGSIIWSRAKVSASTAPEP